MTSAMVEALVAASEAGMEELEAVLENLRSNDDFARVFHPSAKLLPGLRDVVSMALMIHRVKELAISAADNSQRKEQERLGLEERDRTRRILGWPV